MRHVEVLESLLEQIHVLSRAVPRPQRLSVTRTAEQLADQLIEVLHLHPEHHNMLVSTLMDYAAQDHGWRTPDKPPAEEWIEVPAAVTLGGEIGYMFMTYRGGRWLDRGGLPHQVLYWYELPMLPED